MITNDIPKGTTKTSGIYIAVIDRFVYIGKSVCLGSRILAHKNRLLNQKHHNQILQNAYNKYGTIEFTILEFCDKDNLISAEVFWIQYFKYISAHVINLTLGGEGAIGRVLSQDTKDKISKSHIGKIASKEHKEKISLSRKGFKPSQQSIEQGRSKRIGQKRSQETKDKIRQSKLNKTFHIPSENQKINQSRKLGFKPVNVIDPNGIIHTVTTLNGFSRDHGLDSGKLGLVIKGRRKHHRGWTLYHETI